VTPNPGMTEITEMPDRGLMSRVDLASDNSGRRDDELVDGMSRGKNGKD
jgi:hypothetical protein